MARQFGPARNDDPLGIAELVNSIRDSKLSDGKKLGYFYLIATGTFSLNDFDSLKTDLNAVGKKLANRRYRLKKKIEGYDEAISLAQAEIGRLTVEAAKEHQRNLEKLINAVAKKTETEQESGKAQEIEELRKKLHKKP